MRFNEKELAIIAAQPADKEGRVSYKCPGFREVFKERWFKLKGNLLFYFRLNEYGAVYEKEPVGVLVIEHCRIQEEKYAELPYTFSITFANDLEKRHYFGCTSKKNCNEWIEILGGSSYEYLREKLKSLQAEIIKKTGKDPLLSFSSKKHEAKVEETDSDIYFTKVHSASNATADLLLL